MTVDEALALLDPAPLIAAVRLVQVGNPTGLFKGDLVCGLDALRDPLVAQVRATWARDTHQADYLFPFAADCVVWAYDKIRRRKKPGAAWQAAGFAAKAVLMAFEENDSRSVFNGIPAAGLYWLRETPSREDIYTRARKHWRDLARDYIYLFPLSQDGVVLLYAILRGDPARPAEWRKRLDELVPPPSPPEAAADGP